AYLMHQWLKNSEQKLQEINKESDIYSLGVLLWEISSLRPPFEEKNNLHIQIMNGCREIPILGTSPKYSILYSSQLLIFLRFLIVIIFQTLNHLSTKECWQDDPKKRPTIDKVVFELSGNKNDAINKTINALNEEELASIQIKHKENQFHNALEASSNFVPFAPLIDIFIKLGKDIMTLNQEAEHNKHLCSYFTRRVNLPVGFIKDLEIRKQGCLEFFMEQANLQLIKDFIKCMFDVRKFITVVSQPGSFGNLLQANDIVQKYTNLSNMFDGYMAALDVVMNKTTEKEDEIKVIRTNLAEMKKFMFDMSDIKTDSDENIFTDIKRIRELNVCFRENFIKATESSIEPAILNLDDYVPKYKSELLGRFKNIHCRQNNATLLEYAFKESSWIYDEYTVKESGQQVAILKELKKSEINRFYGIAKSSHGFKYYLVTEWMENGSLQEYYKKHKLNWNKKFEFAIDICQGITFLNVVEAKIANFGLIRKVKSIVMYRHADHANINCYTDCENLRYTAPEMFEYGDRQQYTVKCEIYSLEVLLWEIAEEEIPYTREGIGLQKIKDCVIKDKYRLLFALDVSKIWQDIAYA
ncbi:13948_t:CDS:2, partial [Cetraspora pellucida]